MGALDQAESGRVARCHPGISIEALGEYVGDTSLSDQEIATIAAWVDAGGPEGRAARCATSSHVRPHLRNGRMASRTSWCVCRRVSRSRPTVLTSSPRRLSIPKITEDRYVKWVQILIRDATRAVHHSHVYVDLPDGTDTEGLGLGMGSNIGNSMDLIEYGTGNDADIFP